MAETVFLDDIQGSNCAMWKCPVCKEIWTSPSHVICPCDAKPAPVLSKADFVRRYARHEFGNHTQTWETLNEFVTDLDRVDGLVHLRNRNAGGGTYYNLRPRDLSWVWSHEEDRSDWYASKMAPSDYTVFQGEVMWGIGDLDLTYNTLPLPMREGMTLGQKTAHGVTALFLMQRYLDDADWEHIQWLLNNYLDHVVEFSVYSIPCGIYNRRMIVWEIRKY